MRYEKWQLSNISSTCFIACASFVQVALGFKWWMLKFGVVEDGGYLLGWGLFSPHVLEIDTLEAALTRSYMGLITRSTHLVTPNG